MKLKEMQEKRGKLVEDIESLKATAKTEERDLSADEKDQVDTKLDEIESLDKDIAREERQSRLVGTAKGKTTAGKEDTDDVIELNKRDVKRYSLVRAINQLASGHQLDGIERELSDELAKRKGKDPDGFYFPWKSLDVARRDVDKTNTAGDLIATDLMGDEFIDALKNATVVQQAGARVMSDLQGDVDIPKKNASGAVSWVAEQTAPSESDIGTTKVSLSPNTLSGFSDLSRKLLKQSSMDVERMVREDFAQEIAIALDAAAVEGSGSGAEPEGIIPGISATASGSALDYSGLVTLVKTVMGNNVRNDGTGSFVTNADGWEKLATTAKDAGSGLFLMDPETNRALGRLVHVTENVLSDEGTGSDEIPIVFGIWSHLVIALWGATDVIVDPYSQATKGLVRVTVIQEADIARRNDEAFAYSTFSA